MDHSKVIDELGGTAKVAALCEVSMAAVSQWREVGIPKSRLMYLRLARPDVFTQPKRAKPAPQPQ